MFCGTHDQEKKRKENGMRKAPCFAAVLVSRGLAGPFGLAGRRVLFIFFSFFFFSVFFSEITELTTVCKTDAK
jgi:hypothetical protein